MTVACHLSVFFLAILLLAVRPATLQARRAVGRRGAEESIESIETIIKTGAVPHEDSDEWGEDEDEDEDEGEGEASPHGEGGKVCEAVLSNEACNVEDGANSMPFIERSSGSTSDGEIQILAGPVELSVRDRGLVTMDVSAASILGEYQAWHSAEETKHFAGETLGYVTPWHGKGYDFARTFRSKLTYVSPVWYQLRSRGDSGMSSGAGSPSFHLAGGHDFDEAWVADVRNGGAGRTEPGDVAGASVTRIVPRVVLELDGRSRLSQADLREMADLVVTEAILRGYDGFVLDIPLSDGIEEFVSGIKSAGTRRGKELLLIQSVRPGMTLSPRLLEQLVPNLHRFSLMTYDYRPSTAEMHTDMAGGGGVPNSPLSWVRACVEAFAPGGAGSKIRSMTLIGIPFYGYDNGRAITSNDVVSLLEATQKQQKVEHRSPHRDGVEFLSDGLEWHPLWREHVISYRGEQEDKHVATFPTLAFIQERLDLARDLGVGVAFWELGQGMPYWFDLF